MLLFGMGICCMNIFAQQISDHQKTLLFDGINRTYLLHEPKHQPGERLPLVIILHGGGGTSYGMVKITQGGFDELADKERFFVIYPDGVNKHWNDGRNTNDAENRTTANDTGFISSLIDYMISTYAIDPKRVYVTGMSNGAIMSYVLGCKLADKIAAIAPVDGNISEVTYGVCTPSCPVSLLAINNTSDPLVPWDGGDVTLPFSKKKFGKVKSVKASVDFWVNIDGCNTIPTKTTIPDKDPDDASHVILFSYDNGKNGTQVQLYAIYGGGHTWPGGMQYLPIFIIGYTCNDINADKVIWEFFKQHPKQ